MKKFQIFVKAEKTNLNYSSRNASQEEEVADQVDELGWCSFLKNIDDVTIFILRNLWRHTFDFDKPLMSHFFTKYFTLKLISYLLTEKKNIHEKSVDVI